MHAPTEWWQYSDGHWEAEDQEVDLEYVPPAGWGTVELRRIPEGDIGSDAANLEDLNLGHQTSNFQQAAPDGTVKVNSNNIPIAQFGGDGPDWRGG